MSKKKVPISISLTEDLITSINKLVDERLILSRSAFLQSIIEEVVADIEMADKIRKEFPDSVGRVFYNDRYFK